MTWGRSMALACAVAAGSCYEERAYPCESDRQCNLDGVAGKCQETGYCSYPDLACDTDMLRYEPFAGDDLSDRCVDGASSTTEAE